MKPAGTRTVRMPVGLAVRSAAMDCEASRPRAAVLIWQGDDGRIRKRSIGGNAVLEDGLIAAMARLPAGDAVE